MIKGIGIDIIELKRIRKNIQKSNRLVHRILTDRELPHFKTLTTESRQVEFLAGRFAAKEAFAKAVGSGIGELSFQDIHVLPSKSGKPELIVAGYESENLFVSISHSEAYAVAQVIIEGID